MISQIQVSKTIGAQTVEPLRVTTEHKTLKGRCMDIRGWALQIADNHISRTQKIGGFIGNNAMHTPVFKIMAHPTIKQDVASKENGERIASRSVVV
jgi:hypothetical protein